jgi:hypothetical protein
VVGVFVDGDAEGECDGSSEVGSIVVGASVDGAAEGEYVISSGVVGSSVDGDGAPVGTFVGSAVANSEVIGECDGSAVVSSVGYSVGAVLMVKLGGEEEGSVDSVIVDAQIVGAGDRHGEDDQLRTEYRLDGTPIRTSFFVVFPLLDLLDLLFVPILPPRC